MHLPIYYIKSEYVIKPFYNALAVFCLTRRSSSCPKRASNFKTKTLRAHTVVKMLFQRLVLAGKH